jgi:hypothetical protein
MADREEANRFLGMPRGGVSNSPGNEHQRLLGFAVGTLQPHNPNWLDYLRHPARRYRRWVQHRRLGPYAPD